MGWPEASAAPGSRETPDAMNRPAQSCKAQADSSSPDHGRVPHVLSASSAADHAPARSKGLAKCEPQPLQRCWLGALRTRAFEKVVHLKRCAAAGRATATSLNLSRPNPPRAAGVPGDRARACSGACEVWLVRQAAAEGSQAAAAAPPRQQQQQRLAPPPPPPPPPLAAATERRPPISSAQLMACMHGLLLRRGACHSSSRLCAAGAAAAAAAGARPAP